jgi:peptide/nickel transport system substrate-binding protein
VAVKKAGSDTIGTGPYTAGIVDTKEAHLVAFPKYYRGRPAIAKIDLSSYPTQRNAWAALMRGDIDMLYEVSREASDFVAADTAVKTYSFPRPYYIPLIFNVRHPILRNPEVRRAINEALDRVSLVRDGMNGKGRPADGPIWPEHWARSASNPAFTFAPAAARQRLDAAGFRAKVSSGAEGIRFTLTCAVFGNDARFERLAILIQKQLADVGIEVKLVPMTLQDARLRLPRGEFDLALWEMYGRSISYAYDFWHSQPQPRINTGYVGADAVLDRIRSSKSDDEMRAGVAEFARVLYDDPPAAFVAWQEAARAVSKQFDVAAEPNRDILTNVWQWRPAEASKQAAR